MHEETWEDRRHRKSKCFVKFLCRSTRILHCGRQTRNDVCELQWASLQPGVRKIGKRSTAQTDDDAFPTDEIDRPPPPQPLLISLQIGHKEMRNGEEFWRVCRYSWQVKSRGFVLSSHRDSLKCILYQTFLLYLTIKLVSPAVEQPLHWVCRRLHGLLVVVPRDGAQLALHLLRAAREAAGTDLKLRTWKTKGSDYN
jgi:hypothetical protein